MRNGDKESSRIVETNFLIIDIPMAYNVILKLSTLNVIKIIVPPYLLLIQFELDDGGVGKFYVDQKMARKCDHVSLKSLRRKKETIQCEISNQNKVGKKQVPTLETLNA